MAKSGSLGKFAKGGAGDRRKSGIKGTSKAAGEQPRLKPARPANSARGKNCLSPGDPAEANVVGKRSIVSHIATSKASYIVSNNINPTSKSPDHLSARTAKRNVPRDLHVSGSGDLSHFSCQTSTTSCMRSELSKEPAQASAVDLVYDDMVRG